MVLDERERNQLKTNEEIIRAYPSLTFWDIGKYEIEKSQIKVANIQIETPGDFFTKAKPPKLTSEAENKQKQKICHFLKEAVEKGADLVVLPELSTSKDICMDMKEKFSGSQSVIVMGSHYNDYSYNSSLILIDGKFYGQIKNNPSPEEKDYMRGSHDISVFYNTPIGDFAVLICYDATDFAILSALQNYTDFIICVARNKDVVTFTNIFNALTYLQYQYVIFCNDAIYGGSSFYLPFHGKRALDVLGLKNEDILYRNFDLKKLDEMRALPKKDDIFKYPPASIKPRHLPHVNRNQREKKFFESKSFNYTDSFKILNDFLAHVNISDSLAGIDGGSSVYQLEDVFLRSCRAMYAPGMAISAMELQPIVLKYFLVDLVELLCKDDKTILEQRKKSEIIEKLSNIKGKQYILFEIDQEIIRDALFKAPELLDEIFRIYDIENEKKLREIPSELRVARNDFKFEADK